MANTEFLEPSTILAIHRKISEVDEDLAYMVAEELDRLRHRIEQLEMIAELSAKVYLGKKSQPKPMAKHLFNSPKK